MLYELRVVLEDGMDLEELQIIMTYALWLRFQRQVLIHYVLLHPVVVYPAYDCHWVGN